MWLSTLKGEIHSKSKPCKDWIAVLTSTTDPAQCKEVKLYSLFIWMERRGATLTLLFITILWAMEGEEQKVIPWNPYSVPNASGIVWASMKERGKREENVKGHKSFSTHFPSLLALCTGKHRKRPNPLLTLFLILLFSLLVNRIHAEPSNNITGHWANYSVVCYYHK